MGFYVDLFVSFSCDGWGEDHPKAVELAKGALDRGWNEGDGDVYASQFLQHVADGKGYAESAKGAWVSWVVTGNYVDVNATLHCLVPFVTALGTQDVSSRFVFAWQREDMARPLWLEVDMFDEPPTYVVYEQRDQGPERDFSPSMLQAHLWEYGDKDPVTEKEDEGQ